ncbi:hypothetical protein [Segatella copri]|uniref:hypothetical protein n=1 Tax=Segatella copri TaxID=165179 RepID=UPI00222F3385|nr:hypothetical protein [Segatella copri]MCW4080835.1 hypothetical protein [Segatella copri]
MSNNNLGFKENWFMGGKGKQGFDIVLFCMEYTGLYTKTLDCGLEEKHYIYRMVEPRKMHRFEPDLDDGLRSKLDRIKTDRA